MVRFTGVSGRGRIRVDAGEIRGFGVSVRFGRFEMDSATRQLLGSGREVHLTPKAFDLLALLIDEAPRVVRKDELHKRLWPETFVSDATLVGLIKEVRRAVADREPGSPVIRTAHGIGYAFAGDLQRDGVTASVISRWVVVGTRRVALEEGQHVIGRDPSSAIHLDAAGISRRHARIVVTPSDALIEDLNSKNGTLVNDQPLTDRRPLRDGDLIQVGAVLIVYHASASGVSTETIVTVRKP
jgi:DNA-binding winged helix-turn-helix (wHTH) protein